MTGVNPEWVMVGELEKGFADANNALPKTQDLVGKVIGFYPENGNEFAQITFGSSDRLEWTNLADGGFGSASYTATTPRPGIFFVDFIADGESPASVSIVLDLVRLVYTTVIGRMPNEAEINKSLFRRAADGEELTGVRAVIASGVLSGNRLPSPEKHHRTDELVGKRVKYTYSASEVYEHIYLNPFFYTWHCIEGVEKSLADTDRCDHVKIADNLYLFVWREKIVPTLGIVMIDFDRHKTTGKIVGYEGDAVGAFSNFPVGAYVQVLNSTSYAT